MVNELASDEQYPLEGVVDVSVMSKTSTGTEVIPGLGADMPLHNDPVRSPLEVTEETTATSPWLATLPFATWEVELVLDPGTPTFAPTLEPYEVTLSQAWRGQEVGEQISVAGAVTPLYHQGDSRLTLLLPAPDAGVVMGRAALVDGSHVTFTIDGPGAYSVGSHGIAAAE